MLAQSFVCQFKMEKTHDLRFLNVCHLKETMFYEVSKESDHLFCFRITRMIILSSVALAVSHYGT